MCGLAVLCSKLLSEIVTLCTKPDIFKAWTRDCDKQQCPWPWLLISFSDLGVGLKTIPLAGVWVQRSLSHLAGRLPRSDTAFCKSVSLWEMRIPVSH